MAGRQLWLQDSGRASLNSSAAIDPEATVLDTSFSAEMIIDGWQDWMRWDGSNVIDNGTILPGRLDTTLSSFGGTAFELNPLSSGSTNIETSFEDAPFDFDGSTAPTHFSSTPQIPIDSRRDARGGSTSALNEQQTLQDIAMPNRKLVKERLATQVSSPISTLSTPSQSTSPSPPPEPEPRTRKAKRRRSLKAVDDKPSATLCQSRKRGHNAIEKRYRTNLNEKIVCLRQGIPPLWQKPGTDAKSGDEGENSDQEATDKKIAQKYGKAAILTRALEYIQHLESTTQRLGGEVGELKGRVEAFETLAMSGSFIVNSPPQPYGLLTPETETLESIQENETRLAQQEKLEEDCNKLKMTVLK